MIQAIVDEIKFFWHAMFDGTWLCDCERSKWMKERKYDQRLKE